MRELIMSGLIDDSEVDLPCENCGHVTKKNIGWIKSHSEFICVCGTRISLDTDEFRSDLAKIERAFADLQSTLDNFNI